MKIRVPAPTLASAVALALAGASHTADAQSVGRMLERDVRNSAGDAWAVWTAPLRGQARDYLVAGGALALAAAVSPLDDDLDRFLVAHGDSPIWKPLQPFREGGAAFSGRTLGPIAAGALLVSLATRNTRLQEGMFGCMTAYGASSAIRTFFVYPILARTRPDSGHGGPPAPPAREGDQYRLRVPGSRTWGEHSAPGGHMTNVAACATFLSRRFTMGPAEPAMYLISGSVGLGRMLDRRHWLSDNVIGLIFGYAVGKEIAVRSSRRAR